VGAFQGVKVKKYLNFFKSSGLFRKSGKAPHVVNDKKNDFR
jgi:hypothetical protein